MNFRKTISFLTVNRLLCTVHAQDLDRIEQRDFLRIGGNVGIGMVNFNKSNLAMALRSMTTGTVLKTLDWKMYPEDKVSFNENLPEGVYVIHVKVRDEIVALRFLVAYD